MCITCELDITSSAYVTNYIVQMVPGSSCGEHTAGVFFSYLYLQWRIQDEI